MPKCDFCDKEATYDTKTYAGCWAYVCDAHRDFYGVKIKGLETKLNDRIRKSQTSD